MATTTQARPQTLRNKPYDPGEASDPIFTEENRLYYRDFLVAFSFRTFAVHLHSFGSIVRSSRSLLRSKCFPCSQQLPVPILLTLRKHQLTGFPSHIRFIALTCQVHSFISDPDSKWSCRSIGSSSLTRAGVCCHIRSPYLPYLMI